jgi:integrase
MRISANTVAIDRHARPRWLNVKSYVDCSLSPNTKLAYACDLAKFRAWGGTIPCTPRLLARYLAANAASLRPSTLARRVAAIAHAHNAKQLNSPTSSPLVKSTLRGIRRAHGCHQKQALPLTLSMMRRLARPDRALGKLRDARDRALLLLGFAGGFRRSELASLRLGDLHFTRKGVVLRLRSAKTDPYAKGRDVAIPYASSSSVCPVAAQTRWLNLLRPHVQNLNQSGCITNVPLIASIDRNNHVRNGLSAASIGWLLARRMEAAGIPATGYSAHSLRAGLITSAARAGVPIWSIQRQTGHRSPATVQRYIRNLDAFECNATDRLL